MALQATLHKKTFQFSFDARTSRGAMRERVCWFIKVWDQAAPATVGVGECAPLPGLSPELKDDWEAVLGATVAQFNQAAWQLNDLPTDLQDMSRLLQHRLPEAVLVSSLCFALETALLDLAQGGHKKVLPSPFLEGQVIPINGLIWMGGLDYMLQQIEIKIRDGYRCIKLKVGGLDFEKECDVLQYVRRKYFREDITIRLDANGAFKADDALYKLQELARFNIHSIEQPLKTGSDFLPELCAKSPIPVALDEELIGVQRAAKASLLGKAKPPFIILKPSLHGGLASCKEWIELAENQKTGWWITSALESNIGLNAIAQFTAQYPVTLPQGLGTGQIYSNNFVSPLEVSHNGLLKYDPQGVWEVVLDS